MLQRIRTPLLALIAAATAWACASAGSEPSAQATASDGPGLESFASASELQSFVRKMQQLQGRERRRTEALAEMSVSAPPALAVADAAAESSGGEQITNTQEVGVDEGAIVKDAGDFLVVLRRGRLFTIRHGGNALEPVGRIDAFPPDAANPGRTWYDEMLVRGDQIIVIGYSYGDFGTEVNRFRLSPDGRLSYRDTHYLRSGDYYSSSNYAARLIGDELIFYAPVYMNWRNWRSTMPALRRGGSDGQVIDLVEPDDFYVAQPYRDGRSLLGVAHTVTRCDVSAPQLDCEATAVLGNWSRTFYVSRDAVYVWTGQVSRTWTGSGGRRRGDTISGELFRLPLDGSRPGAVPISGAPIDQFSFSEDAGEGVLRVLLREDGSGEGMWASEFTNGDLGLLTIPLDSFGDGAGALPKTALLELPRAEGWRLQNRFVPGYLLYSAANYGREQARPVLYAVPLDTNAVQQLNLDHGVTRIDIMGRDAVAIGPAEHDALGFSAISLGSRARVEDTYLLAGSGEGETRSQAFFYRPDPAVRDGLSGTLGLPVTRRLDRRGGEFLGSGSAIFFLRREDRAFSPAGELVADSNGAVEDSCVASCVDWYGNARPIFLRDRVFALMGYELVEGRIAGGRLRELRRIDFSPAPARPNRQS